MRGTRFLRRTGDSVLIHSFRYCQWHLFDSLLTPPEDLEAAFRAPDDSFPPIAAMAAFSLKQTLFRSLTKTSRGGGCKLPNQGEAILNKGHRSNAESARAAADETDLPNVRARHLRSAEAHEAAAAREEETAAKLKVRQQETAARRADQAGVPGHRNDGEDDEVYWT